MPTKDSVRGSERASHAADSRAVPPLRDLGVEMRGGFVAACAAAPIAIGIGMFAFVGLGDEFFGRGALAGFIAAIGGAFVCVVLGARNDVVYLPRVVTTFFIGTLILQHVVNTDAVIIHEGGAAAVLAIVFAIVFLAGLIQVAFGALRIGSLIRFTPQPVIAGFQNCAALLLVLAQTGQALGFEVQVPLGETLNHLHEAKPLSVVVALVAGVAAWHAGRWVGAMPPLLFGLIVGTVVYYAVVGVSDARLVGPAIGTLPSIDTVWAATGRMVDLFQDPRIVDLLPIVLSGGISIAIIASVDVLLCARMLEGEGMPRTHANRELMRLGAANMMSACVGGIATGPDLGARQVNHAFGGRTSISVLAYGISMLALVAVAGFLIAYVPRSALAGVIVVIGLQHFDRWSLGLTRQVFRRERPLSTRVALDLCVVLLVAMIAILMDLVTAVALGMFLSVAVFLARMSRSVVRRMYRANAARSRRARDHGLMQFLADRGSTILVVELDGAVFFGTAEKLADAVESEVVQETRYVLLDFRRVTEIDSTGAEVVRTLSVHLAERRMELYVCGIVPNGDFHRVLLDCGIVGDRGIARSFVDLDRAIESAEQALIDTECDVSDREGTFPLGAIALLKRMDRSELALVRGLLARRSYAPHQVVFDQGDPGASLFIVVAGIASARMNDSGRERRLMTFGPGGIFGEMGFLDLAPRSATVVADVDLQCLVLDRNAFDEVAREHPAVAVKILSALGRELSARLRLVNRAIVQIDS